MIRYNNKERTHTQLGNRQARRDSDQANYYRSKDWHIYKGNGNKMRTGRQTRTGPAVKVANATWARGDLELTCESHWMGDCVINQQYNVKNAEDVGYMLHYT